MYIINDEERSTDGGKSYNKGHFAEQTISEREYQDRREYGRQGTVRG